MTAQPALMPNDNRRSLGKTELIGLSTRALKGEPKLQGNYRPVLCPSQRTEKESSWMKEVSEIKSSKTNPCPNTEPE